MTSTEALINLDSYFTGGQLPIANCRLPIADCRLPIADLVDCTGVRAPPHSAIGNRQSAMF
jgi:hypothetical protein